MNLFRSYPVRLNHAHASGFSPDYTFPRHYQKNHQLYLVFEGTILYEADGVDLALHAGDGLWLAPGCLRAPRSGGGCGSYLAARTGPAGSIHAEAIKTKKDRFEVVAICDPLPDRRSHATSPGTG